MGSGVEGGGGGERNLCQNGSSIGPSGVVNLKLRMYSAGRTP